MVKRFHYVGSGSAIDFRGESTDGAIHHLYIKSCVDEMHSQDKEGSVRASHAGLASVVRDVAWVSMGDESCLFCDGPGMSVIDCIFKDCNLIYLREGPGVIFTFQNCVWETGHGPLAGAGIDSDGCVATEADAIVVDIGAFVDLGWATCWANLGQCLASFTDTPVETDLETVQETALETALETVLETALETAFETVRETALETADETALETNPPASGSISETKPTSSPMPSVSPVEPSQTGIGGDELKPSSGLSGGAIAGVVVAIVVVAGAAAGLIWFFLFYKKGGQVGGDMEEELLDTDVKEGEAGLTSGDRVASVAGQQSLGEFVAVAGVPSTVTVKMEFPPERDGLTASLGNTDKRLTVASVQDRADRWVDVSLAVAAGPKGEFPATIVVEGGGKRVEGNCRIVVQEADAPKAPHESAEAPQSAEQAVLPSESPVSPMEPVEEAGAQSGLAGQEAELIEVSARPGETSTTTLPLRLSLWQQREYVASFKAKHRELTLSAGKGVVEAGSQELPFKIVYAPRKSLRTINEVLTVRIGDDVILFRVCASPTM